MQCSAQEIEEKRRQAQEKLKRKNLKSSNDYNSPKHNLTKFKSSNLNVSLSNLENSIGFNSTANRFSSPIKSSKSSVRTPIRNSNGATKPYDRPKSVLSFSSTNNTITATCALISEDRFVVELSGYSQTAIEIFKTISSRSYNPNTKQWDFLLSDYDIVQKKLSMLHPNVVIGKIPNYVLNCCRNFKPVNYMVDLSGMDEELVNALMPFQERGVCFGIDKGGRCLIADEMGLGKTFQALGLASYYKTDWPVLIATTASMKNVWEQTIHRYLPSVSLMHTQYMISAKDYIGDAKILIVSHDLMSRCVEKLVEKKFGVLIIDESHTLKNFKAKCTQAATKLAKQARRVVLLSGTPALSRPSELYSQLALIDETFFGNFYDYSKRYCDARSSHFGWDASGKSNLQELEIILAKKFMIRRTKDEVLKSLPNKTQEIVTLDVNLSQFSDSDRKCLNALANNYNQQKKAREKHAALLSFFSETAKIKIPSVCSYILQTLEESNCKFIVFAHHQKILNAMERVLCTKNKKYIRIDGNTSTDQRKFFMDKFQLDDNYICAILSITAANAGITLTAAKLVLFAELHWNPSILSQAESRAHRIGQSEKVTVKYLLAPNTADDYLWPLLQNKQKILNEVGLFKESFENVTVTKQGLCKQEDIAECLGSVVTPVKTLDISTYFKSPEKGERTIDDSMLNDVDITKYFNLSEIDEVGGKESNNQADKSMELEFFNDDLDDALSKVEVNI